MATNVLTSTLKGTQLADPNEAPWHLANNFISPMGYTTSAREGCGSKKSAFEGWVRSRWTSCPRLAVCELLPCRLTLCTVQMLNCTCLSVMEEKFVQSADNPAERVQLVKADSSMRVSLHTRPSEWCWHLPAQKETWASCHTYFMKLKEPSPDRWFRSWLAMCWVNPILSVQPVVPALLTQLTPFSVTAWHHSLLQWQCWLDEHYAQETAAMWTRHRVWWLEPQLSRDKHPSTCLLDQSAPATILCS